MAHLYGRAGRLAAAPKWRFPAQASMTMIYQALGWLADALGCLADAGPAMVLWVLDGRLCDGGRAEAAAARGWSYARWHPCQRQLKRWGGWLMRWVGRQRAEHAALRPGEAPRRRRGRADPARRARGLRRRGARPGFGRILGSEIDTPNTLLVRFLVRILINLV